MKRFLEWTASQAAGQSQANNHRPNQQQAGYYGRRNSHHAGQSFPPASSSNMIPSGNNSSLASPLFGNNFNSTTMQSANYAPSGTTTTTTPTRELEIQHLSKLLHEIKYYQASSSPLPSAASSQSQREFLDKVHKTLPLFLKVFPNQHQLATTATQNSLFLSSNLRDSSCFQSMQSISHLDQLLDHNNAANASLLSSPTYSTKPNSPLPMINQQAPQMDRFPDLMPFAFTLARLFVSEVRQRASNKDAEEASLAILNFLKPQQQVPLSTTSKFAEEKQNPVASGGEHLNEQSDIHQESSVRDSAAAAANAITQDPAITLETTQGWNLLMSLNTLTLSQSSQIIQLLCDASLPSTLIKCLYLFFDLPAETDNQNSNAITGDTTATTTATTISAPIPLIKAFTQLLVQLCSNQAAIDELIKKDDLRLLIGIASSQCSRHNKIWRKTAFQTLLAISKNMRDNFIYLDQNICIQIYVENMHRLNSLNMITIDEYIDMIKTLLEFLYNLDVSNRNQTRSIAPLIEQFRLSRFTDLVEELILKIDETISSNLSQQQSIVNSAAKMEKNDLNQQQSGQSSKPEVVMSIDDYRKLVPSQGSSSDDGGISGHHNQLNSTTNNNSPMSATGRQHPHDSYYYYYYHQNQHHTNNKPSIKQLQKFAFTIIRQLILSAAGDEHLANLLGLLARNLEDLKRLEISEPKKVGGSESDELENIDVSAAVDETLEQKQAGNKELRINLAFLISQEIGLKICILKSLMIILKDSHRCRTLFRKAGGFIYIVSSLETFEKSLPLCDEDSTSLEQPRWKKVNSRKIWRLIKNCLMTIIIAMRFEPANLRAFSDDVLEKFTGAIRNLGCFRADQKSFADHVNEHSESSNKAIECIDFDLYKSIFLAPSTRDLSTMINDNIRPSEACCQLIKFLYDMSIDLGDGSFELELHLDQLQHKSPWLVHKDHSRQTTANSHHVKSISVDQDTTSGPSSLLNFTSATKESSGVFKKRSQLNMAPKRPPSLDLESKSPMDNANLTFPCFIISIIDLIPSFPSNDLKLFVCQVIKSLFKHERNLQLLCEAGMISKLLNVNFQSILLDKKHFLNELISFMLEKLTKQVITPKELHMFLRLNEPLKCKNLDDIEVTESSEETKLKLMISNNNGGTFSCDLEDKTKSQSNHSNREEKISRDRIESLMAMMSADDKLPGKQFNSQPPYVEFNLNSEGFTTIFMPSIAPVNVKSLPVNGSSFLNSTLDVHTNEKNGILGGVGTIERQFPPMAGLTFSSWFKIEKFPSRSSNPSHNIRLLTIYRGSASTGKEYSCFRIQISALDRALTVSTQEALLFDNNDSSCASNSGSNNNLKDSQHDPDCNLRIWTPELLLEGKWHHLGVTINRSPMKLSRISLYIDGMLVHQQRICYINTFVGSTNSGPLGNSQSGNVATSAAAYVNAFIGSLPQYRFRLKTQWKQGPCHLIEEPLSANFVSIIYALGPNFIGNFQNSQKLHEVARQILPLQQSLHDSTSGQQHGQLVHQQSASVVGLQQQQQNQRNQQLTRLSSTNLNSYSNQHSTSSSPNSFNFNLNEDRLLMSIDARAASMMTIPRMRRIYTRFDCRQVSRVLGLAMHESSAPILLLHNTGVHLNGPSRGIGALTLGYNHVRCFVPSPTQQSLISLGGCYILLGLVAQAQTSKSFELSLAALVNALKSNSVLEAQMDHINGYQILSVFYWKKKHLISTNILKLTFSLITDTPGSINCRFATKAKDATSATTAASNSIKTIQQTGALRDLICECFDLWLQTDMINLVLEFIYDLISSTPSSGSSPHQSSSESMAHLNFYNPINVRMKNLRCLRDMDLLPRMFRLLPQYESQQVVRRSGLNSISPDIRNIDGDSKTFDTKSIYLIKQTVFELLNRTSRQSDILYFGQFLASLLPSKTNERSPRTISLRNILLKSLLQMMTENKQAQVNHAMQEELVRILGFDWFMLFISGAHLDCETITLGFLNLMIILSNDDLYASFKSSSSLSPVQPKSSTSTPFSAGSQRANSSNGGWLKEPIFPSMDGKFNIQLLGINVGVFFGLNGKRQSIKQDVLEAPNFFLLTNCLTNLIELPRIYLMIFQTMMSRFNELNSNVIDTISAFDQLNLGILCDSLVGDTHHKRRQTLANIKFKCHELVVCLIYMVRDIIWHPELLADIDAPNNGGNNNSSNDSSTDNNRRKFAKQFGDYPIDLIRFLMYLYNNNNEFQQYCRRSDELIDALCEVLMEPANDNTCESPTPRAMTQHPASKEILELSRLIISDTMIDNQNNSNPTATSQSAATTTTDLSSNYEQLHAFERFFNSLADCRAAQGELVDILLRQILLMIDSTARHNSIKTIGSSDNILQFQLLLTNSILVSQLVTDKIWLRELYSNNLNRISMVIDHQLCLAEQTFKFNELLPKSNPPLAFIMQRVLNRSILFSLSRPMQHMSDKMLLLDLLKKIYDNKTIIILNHMHSPQSAEFFVCISYCLIRIIEENSMPFQSSMHADQFQQPSSLIERQFNNHQPSLSLVDSNPSSLALMLVSMAKKVWDAIYQSKKGFLSEAFDVSLSLPAFTLDTSLDLIQLKPDIIDTCERYWSNFLDSERKLPKRRHCQKQQSETASGSNSNSANTATSAAVNILSGRLTKVVNAASFVSRVVGATAGSVASNVNLVGEKFGQQSSRVGQSGSGAGGFGQSSGLRKDFRTNSELNLSSSASANNQSNSNICLSRIDQSELFKCPSLNKKQLEEATSIHISIIDDYIESHLTQKSHVLALHKYLCDEWLDIEFEILLRERALFGPSYESVLDKWCLDLTEGPRRMRKKMVNNTRQFYENYPYRPDQYNPSNKSLRYRPPMSYDSYLYYMKNLNIDRNLLEMNDNFDNGSVGEQLLSIEMAKSSNALDTNQAKLAANEVEVETSTPKQSSPIALSCDEADDENEVAKQTSRLNINVDSPSPIKSIQDQPSERQQHSSIESLSSVNNKSNTPNQAEMLAGKSSSPKPAPSLSDLGGDDGDSTSFVDFSPEIEAETNSARESAENIDSLSVLRLLEKNERLSHMFRCSRVQGLDTYEGLLLFGREHFYLIDGFTLLKTREIKDIDSLPPDAHDPIIPNSTPNILAHSKKTCAKFAYDSVVEVHKRRYLLQPIALEVFSSDGRNTLIVFPRNIRNKVYSRLMTVSTQLTNNASESLAGQKSNVSVEGGSGLLSNLIGETSVTQRWVRGELSNFQYLMNLNTIAGRSYNDLMQYPIFPWILADYHSDQLDFTKASTFRDLSRPVGAQTSDRLEQFKRRYSDWDDTETPPYHYGTFYSSAMIVAAYMVRMEPFTQHFLRLQGGHFDLADRMFHSIQDSWLSASKHNMADIKELIPEFFYLPEFLKNSNKFDLGIKQNGMKLNDVILPPWAKGDAREFIRLHRAALESDFVSSHLHEWIDLIFGYKQQGQAAVDSVNVFHHLFYEGNVDIYNTDIDPIKKNAVIGFINNFGQVPKQLFKRPHPVRKVLTSTSLLQSMTGGNVSSTSVANLPSAILPSLSSASSSLYANQKLLTHHPNSLRLTNANYKDLRGPVGQIVQVDQKAANIVAVEQNKLLIPPEYCRYIAWGHADRSLRLGLYDSEKPIFVWEGSDVLAPMEILSCTIPNNRIMITAGTESILTVWKIEKMKTFQPILNLYGHVEPITCLASSQSYSLIVSGSRDRTAIIWDLNRFTFVRQLGGSSKSAVHHHGPISAISINDSTGDIATCATSWLYLWTINGELLAHIDTLNITIQQSILSAGFNSSVSSNMSQLHILSACFSQANEWDSNEVIVTGASDGSVAIWSMRYYQCPMTAEQIEADLKLQQESVTQVPHETVESIQSASDGADQQTPGEIGERDPLETESEAGKHEKMNLNRNRDEPENSEPIPIRAGGRQRTDTMNSDWVRLSASSTSTIETIPVRDATPSSLTSDTANELMASAMINMKLTDSPTSQEASRSDSVHCATESGSATVTGGFFPQDQQQGQQETHGANEPPLCLAPTSLDAGDTARNRGGGSPSPLLDVDDKNPRCCLNYSLAATSGPDAGRANLLMTPNDPSLIKFSKSDSSLVDSFVIVGTDPNSSKRQSRPQSSTGGSENQGQRGASMRRRLNSQNARPKGNHLKSKLLPNHYWKRELYLRALLPRGNGKNQPIAAVTSITMSKDHKTIFVGDATGRIHSYTTS